MASHLIVEVEFVPTAPLGFQKYIETYFVKKQVLGREVYSAVRYLHAGQNSWNGYGRGVAPYHSVSLMYYDKDMPGGVSLCTWIHEQVKDGQHMWEFHGGDDPCEHHYDDD